MMMSDALPGARVKLKEGLEMDATVLRVTSTKVAPVIGKIVSRPNRSGQVQIDGDFGQAYPQIDQLDLVEPADVAIVNEAARLKEAQDRAADESRALRADFERAMSGASSEALTALTARLEDVERQCARFGARLQALVTDVEGIGRDVATSNAERESLAARVDEIRSKIASEIDAVNARVSSFDVPAGLTSRLDAIEAKLASA